MQCINEQQVDYWMNQRTSKQRKDRAELLAQLSTQYAMEDSAAGIDMAVLRMNQAEWLLSHLGDTNAH